MKTDLIFVKTVAKQGILKTKNKTARLLVTLVVAVLLLSVSYLLSVPLTKYFSFLGARDILPLVYYFSFTACSLVVCANLGGVLLISEDEKRLYLSLPINGISIVVAKLLPLYLINLALAFFVVFIPSLFLVDIIGPFVLAVSLLLLPLIPISISLIFTVTLYYFSKLKHAKLLSGVLFFTFLLLLFVAGGYAFDTLKNNAYHTGVLFGKYYFPAGLFHRAVMENSFIDLVLFVLVSLSAFYIYLYTLKKINKV